MYDYSDDLSNYQGKGWPIEEEIFYGNQENLQEKVELKMLKRIMPILEFLAIVVWGVLAIVAMIHYP